MKVDTLKRSGDKQVNESKHVFQMVSNLTASLVNTFLNHSRMGYQLSVYLCTADHDIR